MKDNFSDKSDLYKQYRPEYPAELLEYVLENVSNYDTAWDCGTGNGQIAKRLSTKFNKVFATDISEQQLLSAEILPNIVYSNQSVEKTNFPENSFDLITVGQAVHWFDFNKFYKEVNRTSKNNALIAIVGYGKLKIEPGIDNIIGKLYFDILGSYWDKERRYIDENYLTIPFPFYEINGPVFSKNYFWTLQQLFGYLDTWSACKHYIKEKNTNPVNLIKTELITHWAENEIKQINFPILTRFGRIVK